MYTNLMSAIENSDLSTARASLKALLDDGHAPWRIHEALFSISQRVLNPPFINPHLPKAYAISRDLIAYLNPEDIVALLGIEVEEYTWRDKGPVISKYSSIPSINDF